MAERVTNACSHGRTWCDWCHTGGGATEPYEGPPISPSVAEIDAELASAAAAAEAAKQTPPTG